MKNYIIKALGDMHMGDVTADDIRLALLTASKKSASVYKSVNVIYKCIFTAAMESKIIDENPDRYPVCAATTLKLIAAALMVLDLLPDAHRAALYPCCACRLKK